MMNLQKKIAPSTKKAESGREISQKWIVNEATYHPNRKVPEKPPTTFRQLKID
jgi:hypothetical protein